MAANLVKTVRSRDGTPIAYDRVGEGRPLILVGGALSTRGAATAVAALLAPHFTVFSFDRRGRGDSGDTAPYAVEREHEDLAALVEEAGGSAFAAGVSSGAVLALDAAAHGVAIAKLALYEPPLIVDGSRTPVPSNDYVRHLNELLSAGRRGDAVEYFMKDAVQIPAQVVAQTRQSPMWPSLEALAPTLLYDGLIMGEAMSGSPAPLRRWAAVDVPTLVMDGGASPEWMHHGADALAAILPAASRRTLAGQTHAVDPAVLAPALADFFGA